MSSLSFPVFPVSPVVKLLLEGEMINVDCAFRMGKAHLVCQDYAAGTAGEFPCVVLADGCSGSPDTDIGARLLVKTAQRFAPDLPNPCQEEFCGRLETYHNRGVQAARLMGEDLCLSDMALDATLLTLAVRDGSWFASLFGDGAVAAKVRGQDAFEVTVVSYPGGYPYYPNYLADPERRKTLLTQENSGRVVETFQISQQDEQELCSETYPADFHCHTIQGELADYEWVAVLSDGIHSFTEVRDTPTGRTNAPVPLAVVLRELLAFKTSGGQFAQRRMQKFQQQCAARGWQHHDDVTMGVIMQG